MKAVLAVIAGFVISLAIFVSGAVVAGTMLTAKPVRDPVSAQDQTALWTAEPRTVREGAESQLERLPARAVPADAGSETPARSSSAQDAGTEPSLDTNALDMTTTASIDQDAASAAMDETTNPQGRNGEAHVAWCMDRYRSYDAGTNSYRPYSGGRRACVSPYSDGIATAPVAGEEIDFREESAFDKEAGPADYRAAEADGVFMSADHVDYCFSRYRSYDPRDNSYQPYDGGPRRQCR
jgi:hypothetical protein